MPETLEFSRSLYSPDAVQSAARAYSELAKIEVEVGDDDLRVQISEPDADLADTLADEFANHVLHETIVRTREGE